MSVPLEYLVATAQPDDGAPSPAEQAEFHRYIDLVNARDTLAEGVRAGDPQAIEFAGDLALVLMRRTASVPPKPAPKPAPDGNPF